MTVSERNEFRQRNTSSFRQLHNNITPTAASCTPFALYVAAHPWLLLCAFNRGIHISLPCFFVSVCFVLVGIPCIFACQFSWNYPRYFFREGHSYMANATIRCTNWHFSIRGYVAACVCLLESNCYCVMEIRVCDLDCLRSQDCQIYFSKKVKPSVKKVKNDQQNCWKKPNTSSEYRPACLGLTEKVTVKIINLWSYYPFVGFNFVILQKRLEQGFPNWGTCTPRGTFAYLKRYI